MAGAQGELMKLENKTQMNHELMGAFFRCVRFERGAVKMMVLGCGLKGRVRDRIRIQPLPRPPTTTTDMYLV